MASGRHIVLVACCGLKRREASAARDLYQSALFRFARRWAERHSPEDWYILSAKHGLLAPLTRIEPYDETLATVGVRGRREWDERVLLAVRPLRPDAITVLAGANYCGWCEAFPNVVRPLRGLGIGRQLAWFKAALCRPPETS